MAAPAPVGSSTPTILVALCLLQRMAQGKAGADDFVKGQNPAIAIDQRRRAAAEIAACFRKGMKQRAARCCQMERQTLAGRRGWFSRDCPSAEHWRPGYGPPESKAVHHREGKNMTCLLRRARRSPLADACCAMPASAQDGGPAVHGIPIKIAHRGRAGILGRIARGTAT